MTIPQIVLDLAATVNGGTPLAWHEYDDHWTIVMQDGRKMHFAKNAAAVNKPQHEVRASEPQASIAHPGAKGPQGTVQDHKETAVDQTPARRHPPRRDK